MNDISVNHHTIPQFYLNNFAVKVKKGYNIEVFNKNRMIKFQELVKNVGFIKNFNTVEIEESKTDIFEKMHNEVFEKFFSYRYQNIIRKINMYNQREYFCYNCMSLDYYRNEDSVCINYYDKADLSYLLAYFIFRGRKIRYVEEGLYEREKDILIDIYKSQGYKDINEIEKKINEHIGKKEEAKFNQLISLFGGEELHELADIIYKHIWVIAYNNTDSLLYTSDNGHALDYNTKTKSSIGYNTFGNIIVFPLSSRICILMFDERMYNNLYKDFSFHNLDKKEIKKINECIIYDGIDEIYSKDGNWSMLDEYYTKSKIPKGHKSYRIY